MSMRGRVIRAVAAMFMVILAVTSISADELDDIQRMIETGQTGEATVRLNNYRRAHPDDPRALLYRARLTDDLDQARALLREVELLALRGAVPDSAIAAEATYAGAELYLAIGNTGAAVNTFDRLVLQYPHSARIPDAMYRLGMIALMDGDKAGAIARFDSCLAHAGTGDSRMLAATGRMEAYVQLGRWREALDAAHAVLEEDDEDSAVTPRVLEVMSIAWRQMGNVENADRFMQRLLETYPESVQAHAAREAGKKLAAGTMIPDDDGDTDMTPAGTSGTGSQAAGEASPAASQPPRQANAGPAFAVQASAFSDRANAYRMYRDLREKGFDASIDMRTVGEQHFYKVLVGRYGSRAEAEQTVNSVSRATGVRAIVVILE